MFPVAAAAKCRSLGALNNDRNGVCSTAVEARSSKAACGQSHTPSETCGDHLLCFSPLRVVGTTPHVPGLLLQKFNLCLGCYGFLPGVCACVAPLLVGTTAALDQGPTLLQYDPILTNYLYNDPITK